MVYLYVIEIGIKVVWHLILMLCCWMFSMISMNWMVNGRIMEKIAFLGGERGKRLFKWIENVSGKSLKIQHQYYQYIGSKKAGQAWWRKLFISWIVAWVLFALWLFWFLNSHAFEKRRETLTSMCDERARMLQDQFNVSMNHIQALSILIATFHHSKNPSSIDQNTFARYTERTTFERPLTSGVAYAVKVLNSERKEFEKQQKWTIKRMDKLEKTPVQDAALLEPSPLQEEYAPVIFAQDTISHVISLDLLSGKEDRDNILRARSSGKGVLTAPFRLFKTNRLGVILTFAVYKTELPSNATPNERIQATDGYLGGVFDIESLVEKLLHQLASKQTIFVNVFDTTDPSQPISMYGSNETDDGMIIVSPLNFGDPFRKHEMRCRFKQKPPWPWLALTTPIGMLVIALLVGYICYATISRIAKVEEDYRVMSELRNRAEAADVAKSQFLATVSHEIRTPMNGVLGMLQMLMDTDLDITQQDYVRTAQASGKTLVSLINEVLDQARIESGKLELEAVRFDLRAILDDVLSLFSGKSQKKGIELAVYVSDRVPEVLIGDAGRFRQIITNLMGNSIKFTEKGHIFVTVNLVEEVMGSIEVETEASLSNTLSGFPVVDRRSSYGRFRTLSQEETMGAQTFSSTPQLINLIVSVEDTGVGIPYDAQSRVFTPFMQVGPPSISRIHGGTGIGLSISKCLVSLMKGEIGFASEPHVGSTFTFTAVFTNGNSHDHKTPQISKQPKYVSSEFQGMKALVVDPRLVRAKVTKYHFQRLGIHVEAASELNQAIPCMTSGTATINMVLVEKESWEKDPELSDLFVSKLRIYEDADPLKLFVLANSLVPSKTSAVKSASYTPLVILKPLRASMLAASLQRAMGVGNKRVFRNGGLHHLQSLENLLQGRQILVVDDNKVNLKVAAGALKKYGAKVECVDSGKEAVRLLKPPHQFDACFMDIQMPEMDGFEATKRIRDMESSINNLILHDEVSIEEACGDVLDWHVPILAMTADVIQATHEECLNNGMDGYVSKPFEGEQLYREVARFLKST
ncbi:histidine kinase [Ranunculus cassubicifolius]